MTCGVHRFCALLGPKRCPWCEINRLTADVSRLRAQLGQTPSLGPLTDVPEVEACSDGRRRLRTLNERGGWTYTYLDDAPLEERRARAVSVRRTLPAEDASRLGALDAEAIEQVIRDAQPPMRDADELHEALLQQVISSPFESALFKASLRSKGKRF